MAIHKNEVTLIGNLGGDPKSNDTNNGKLVVNMRLATTDYWRDKNTGEDRSETEWHSIAIFDEHTAQFVLNNCSTGDKLLVRGKIKTTKFTDRDGIQREGKDIVVNPYHGEVMLLERKNGAQRGQQNDQGGYEQRSQGDNRGGAQQQDRYDDRSQGGQQRGRQDGQQGAQGQKRSQSQNAPRNGQSRYSSPNGQKGYGGDQRDEYAGAF